jgi:dTDP-4-dehydrorhamnose 3,5-epimerase
MGWSRTLFKNTDTRLPGCVLLTPRVFRDLRGTFVKSFMSTAYRELGLATEWAEDFWSTSAQGVLRGLHFQRPPNHHAKTVLCLQGRIFDVVVDLRLGSPTFGLHQTFHLDAANPTIIYIPPGLAHGFQVIAEEALVFYKTASVYVPDADTGVRWSSCDISWPLPAIVSSRDEGFETLNAYKAHPLFKFAPTASSRLGAA